MKVVTATRPPSLETIMISSIVAMHRIIRRKLPQDTISDPPKFESNEDEAVELSPAIDEPPELTPAMDEAAEMSPATPEPRMKYNGAGICDLFSDDDAELQVAPAEDTAPKGLEDIFK